MGVIKPSFFGFLFLFDLSIEQILRGSFSTEKSAFLGSFFRNLNSGPTSFLEGGLSSLLSAVMLFAFLLSTDFDLSAYCGRTVSDLESPPVRLFFVFVFPLLLFPDRFSGPNSIFSVECYLA